MKYGYVGVSVVWLWLKFEEQISRSVIQSRDDVHDSIEGLFLITGSMVVVKCDTAVDQYNRLDILHLTVGLVDSGTKCLFVVIAAISDMRNGYSYHTVVRVRYIDEMKSPIDEMAPSVAQHVHLST